MICLPIYPSKIMPVMVQKSFLNLNSNILQVYSFPLFQVQVVSAMLFWFLSLILEKPGFVTPFLVIVCTILYPLEK